MCEVLTMIAAITHVALFVSFVSLLVRLCSKSPRITKDGCSPRIAPFALPLIGHGLIFLQERRRILLWFKKCIFTHGRETLLISVPSLPPGVIISDPENLEFVFRHEHIFEKGLFFTGRLRDLFGDGILNTDGDLWKQQRRIGVQLLAPANLRQIARSELPEILSEVIADLRKSVDVRTAVDLEVIIHEITTQLMGRMTYGATMHTNDEFTLSFNDASLRLAKRFQNPVWFITEIFTGSRLRASIRMIKAYSQLWVSQAAAPKSNLDISKVFIGSLFAALGDETLVADSALNFFSAGRDTVAQALTWTLYLLQQHPVVTDTLLQAIKHHDAAADNTIPPYLLAVFYESLRLYPPLPLDIKQACRDTVLPDGTFLPKNSIIVWSTWAMNRSRETWGSDADAFLPARWLHDGTFQHRKPGEFPAFQGGPRACLGKKMAEMVFAQIVTVMVTTFEMLPAYKGEKLSRTHLTMPMDGGLPTFLKVRSQDYNGAVAVGEL